MWTGDVAHSGDRREYLAATDFLEELTKTLQISPKRLFIIPGNHDLMQSEMAAAHELLVETIGLSDFGKLDSQLLEGDVQELLRLSNRIFDNREASRH